MKLAARFGGITASVVDLDRKANTRLGVVVLADFKRADYDDGKLALQMAAAPDMLAALLLALPELEQEAEQRETSGNDEYGAGIRAVAEAARTAIAKATGAA